VNFDRLSLKRFCLGKSIPGHLAFAEEDAGRSWRFAVIGGIPWPWGVGAVDGQAADCDPNWVRWVFISGCRLIKQGSIAASPSAIDPTSPLSPRLHPPPHKQPSPISISHSRSYSPHHSHSFSAAPSLAIRLITHY
jgi:hypothetical protein